MTHQNEHSPDAGFKLKEIAYFMKHFMVKSNDSLANNIISDLNQFLKLGGDCNDIIEYLTELEEYAPKSSSEDYLWELVYARRTIKSFFEGKENYETAVENALIATKHFDIICKLTPSNHNFCCRILENLTAVDCIKKTKSVSMKTNQIKEIYHNCYRLFGEMGEIEEAKKELYYMTACYLYLDIYLFSRDHNDPKNVSFDWLSTYINFAIKRYEVDKSNSNLRQILVAYAELSEYQNFSYKNEKESIHNVLAWAETAIEKDPTDIKRPYNRLKEIVQKFENPVSSSASGILN